MPAELKLFEIAHALYSIRLAFGFLQRWQQHGRENGDDRDDNQKLYQCETPCLGTMGS
jgi:hypothetical protein